MTDRTSRHWRQQRDDVKAALISSLLIAAGSASAQCQYEAIPIPETCNGGWTPWGVNDHSTVVGFQAGCSSANWKPFIWTAETGTSYLPVPQGQGIVSTAAVRIADDGTIVGLADKSNGLSNLIVWRTDGSVTIYYPAGGPAEVNQPAIRFDGAILGEYQTGSGAFKGFILMGDEFLPLPAPLANEYGGFKSVNRSGWATGRYYKSSILADQPFLWDGESDAVPVGLPAGYSRGYGSEIDCVGRIAGDFRQLPSRRVPNPAWHAALWDSGAYSVLPLLPGFTWSSVRGMNDAGQIVGECSKPGPPQAFFWQNGATTLLSSLITPSFSGILSNTLDINERGEITAKSQSQMYLLRPIGVVPADVDINCRVDVNDLNVLFRCWGPVATTTPERADVNGDGWVDAADLAEVLGAWTP